MRKAVIIVSLILCAFGALSQSAAITEPDGQTITGYVRATLLVYSQPEGGDLVWTGTTDGSLPALRLENGYIHNIDNILPGYVRDRGELWIEVLIDGRMATDGRMRYTSSIDRSLHRDTPADPGEVSETLVDELQIGLPGHELYVASATTGFGVDTPVEKVDIDGAIGLKERTAPTPTTDFGKVYVDDSDGHLYFMDEGGTSTDLLETSAAGGGGYLLAAFDGNMYNTCVGQDLWMDVHYGGEEPLTHLWTGDTGPLSATNIPDPVFNASTAGMYSLLYTITDSEGGQSHYSMRVNVHAAPSPSIDAYPPSGGCVGEPVVLTGDGCFEKYCWNPGGPCTKSFQATRSGSFDLSVVDRWGCEGTASYSVTFLDPPSANAGANSAECSGGTDPGLGGSPSAAGGTPPYTYYWTGSGAPYLSSPTAANPTFDVTAASPGVFSLTLEVTDLNGCTDDDGPVVVTVYPLPVASISATTPVCPGDAISFSGGAAAGLGPYSYTWSGPSGFSSFIQNPEISSAVEGNQGTYSLTVTDAHGCTSAPTTFSVTVDDPAVITVNPVDVSVCEGLGASFSVTASGTAPFTYQWHRHNGSSWSPISGATASSYTESGITPSMNGYQYRCEVTSACSPSATSASATLTVLLAPTITSHPADQTVDEGDPATFSVTASGETPYSYQWQQSTDSGSSWANVGSDSDTYTTGATTESMTGYQYRVVVTGACSPAVTSSAAVLTVASELYTFSSHTFTPCGATGRQGPTLTQCRSSYSPSPSWDDDPALFGVGSTGIQMWTVPADGTYRITVAGARGGYYNSSAGRGVILRGDFTLTRGEILYILPGQHGEGDPDYPSSTMYDTGGGGGSFAWLTTSAPLIAAGGGGGHCYEYTNTAYEDAVYTACGQDSYCSGDCYESYSGGCSGLGGETSPSYPIGAGGAGFLGDGDDSSIGDGGQAIIAGGLGGLGEYDEQPGGQGGFGGGGGAIRYSSGGREQGPGGGGGWSGGAGSDDGSAGGGGSYNSGANQATLGYNTGDGYVTVQYLP